MFYLIQHLSHLNMAMGTLDATLLEDNDRMTKYGQSLGISLCQQTDKMYSLLRGGKYSDFTVCCGDRVWKAHRAILCARSKYFETFCESNAEVSNISMPNFSRHTSLTKMCRKFPKPPSPLTKRTQTSSNKCSYTSTPPNTPQAPPNSTTIPSCDTYASTPSQPNTTSHFSKKSSSTFSRRT